MDANNGGMNRKSEKVRRANRVIQNRTMIVMAVLGVVVFIALFFKLFSHRLEYVLKLQYKGFMCV